MRRNRPGTGSFPRRFLTILAIPGSVLVGGEIQPRLCGALPAASPRMPFLRKDREHAHSRRADKDTPPLNHHHAFLPEAVKILLARRSAAIPISTRTPRSPRHRKGYGNPSTLTTRAVIVQTPSTSSTAPKSIMPDFFPRAISQVSTRVPPPRSASDPRCGLRRLSHVFPKIYGDKGTYANPVLDDRRRFPQPLFLHVPRDSLIEGRRPSRLISIVSKGPS